MPAGSHWAFRPCCKYCPNLKIDLDAGKTSLRFYDMRNVENYEECVREATEGERTHMKGVKSDSIMNQLSSFHATDRGSPLLGP